MLSFTFSNEYEVRRTRRGCGSEINTTTWSRSMGSSSSLSSGGCTAGRGCGRPRRAIGGCGGCGGRNGLRSPPNMRVRNVIGRSEGTRNLGRRGFGVGRNAVAESGYQILSPSMWIIGHDSP